MDHLILHKFKRAALGNPGAALFFFMCPDRDD